MVQPTTATPRAFLEQYRGGKIFHPRLEDDKGVLVGNNGDRLMVLGTDIVYRDLGIRQVQSGEDADLIVIGGNGGMLERAHWIPLIFRNCCRDYPDVPVCVLPSTYYYPTRPFAEEVGNRTAPVTLFCREPYSFKHLTEDHELPANARVELARDMAFELAGSELVTSLRQMKPKHVVMVERTDVEHSSVAFDSNRMRARIRIAKLMPSGMKRAIYPLITALRARKQSPFRLRCEALLKEHLPEAVKLPRVVADLSNVNVCPFEEFCRAIGDAVAVFTTRLHVGILAGMLGKPTFIFEGPYHKIRGIYEYSLKDLPHVHFVANQ